MKPVCKDPACTCPAISPFRWRERYVPGTSFAMVFQRSVKSSQASTDYVDAQRSAGLDVGHIHGLTEKNPPHRHSPGQFVTQRAQTREAEALRPARNAITITPRGEGERSRKKRMAAI